MQTEKRVRSLLGSFSCNFANALMRGIGSADASTALSVDPPRTTRTSNSSISSVASSKSMSGSIFAPWLEVTSLDLPSPSPAVKHLKAFVVLSS